MLPSRAETIRFPSVRVDPFGRRQRKYGRTTRWTSGKHCTSETSGKLESGAKLKGNLIWPIFYIREKMRQIQTLLTFFLKYKNADTVHTFRCSRFGRDINQALVLAAFLLTIYIGRQ